MGGWFLDILIGYWVRVAIRLFKARGSNEWPSEEATVLTSSASNSYGGPVAEVIYSFSHHGRYLSGTHQKPFLLYDSAKRYAAGFPMDTPITVRVNPGNPMTSIVRDQDQAAMKLRARFD
jgi:hypothetical protein